MVKRSLVSLKELAEKAQSLMDKKDILHSEWKVFVEQRNEGLVVNMLIPDYAASPLFEKLTNNEEKVRREEALLKVRASYEETAAALEKEGLNLLDKLKKVADSSLAVERSLKSIDNALLELRGY